MGGRKSPPAPIFYPPAIPAYTPPAPYSPPPAYNPPAPYAAPPDPQGVIPQVMGPGQIISQANEIGGYQPGSVQPGFLQLNLNPSDPAQIARAEQAYRAQYVDPQVAALKAQGISEGRGYGSFLGGEIAGAQAMGDLAAYQAGQAKLQQDYNNLLAARQSYYGNEVAVPQQQNTADVSRGQSVAQLQGANAANQNQYSLSAADAANRYGLASSELQNQYNLSANQGQNQYGINAAQAGNNAASQNYLTQQNAYNQQQQLASQRAFGLGALGLGALQTGLQFAGPIGQVASGAIGLYRGLAGTGSRPTTGRIGPTPAQGRISYNPFAFSPNPYAGNQYAIQ